MYLPSSSMLLLHFAIVLILTYILKISVKTIMKKTRPVLQFCRTDLTALLRSHVRQAKFCLRVVRWFFSGISRFRPTFQLTRLKMSEIILTGRKNKNNNNKNIIIINKRKPEKQIRWVFDNSLRIIFHISP